MTTAVPAPMTAKRKFPRADALKVAAQLCKQMQPHCATKPDGSLYLVVAGSLRRRCREVGDIEILFVPKMETLKCGLLPDDVMTVSKVDVLLDWLLEQGVIEKRRNVNGSEIWGAKNKLARHVKTGIPVDFFATAPEHYYNYLVCRTGSAKSNIRIASEARRRGLQWMPYGQGFRNDLGQEITVTSERQVFETVGLPFLQPWERVA